MSTSPSSRGAAGAGARGPRRPRPAGPALGPLPLAAVVVVELGLTTAVALVAADRALLGVAGVVLSGALLLGLLRHRGQWLVLWAGRAVRFRLRTRVREAAPVPAAAMPGADPASLERLATLRLLVGDLRVAALRDHDGQPVGMVGLDGAWCAVLAVDEAAVGLLTDPDGPTGLPVDALSAQLTDRGVVLDSITALYHGRRAGAALAPDAPAVGAYREILGPLPAMDRRTVWLVIRLDPARCPEAVHERAGGTLGAQRALLGALARVLRAVGEHGPTMRPLGPEEVLRAAVEAGDLAGLGPSPTATERWDALVTAGATAAVGHATWAVTTWPGADDPSGPDLTALTATGATTTTVALTLEPGADPDEVGVRTAVRLTARVPEELTAAGEELAAQGAHERLQLDRADGRQAAGLVATLPVPGAAPPRTRRGAAIGPTAAPTVALASPPALVGPPVAPGGGGWGRWSPRPACCSAPTATAGRSG